MDSGGDVLLSQFPDEFAVPFKVFTGGCQI